MSDSDLPGEGTADDTALSFDDGVDAIENLFGAPETDLSEEDQGQEDTAGEEEGEADEASADDDPDVAEEDDQVQADEAGGPGSKGQFVSKDAKFRLEDGTVISVGDLARNNLFQADYTRKTEELKTEKVEFDRDKQRVEAIAQQVLVERDLLLQATQYLLPPPDKSMLDENSPNFDPQRFYLEKEHYNERLGVFRQLYQNQQQQEQQKRSESEEQQKATREKEAQRLLEAAPEFKDQKVYARFMTDVVPTMARYGITPADIEGITDHRYYLAMRDLVKFHKARAGAPKVAENMRGKPVLQGGKRMDPKGKTTRETSARAELLRKTGSLEAGIASLMDLDL